MNINESAAASTKVVGAAAIISRALYRVLTICDCCDYAPDDLGFAADLVLYSSSGTVLPVYILVRTDYLAPLTLPSDVLLIEIAVNDERMVELLSKEPILEGGEKIHGLYYGPWKRRGGASSRRLCEKERE